MTLLSLEHIVGCEGYYIDDQDLKIWSFKQNNKNGKLMKLKAYVITVTRVIKIFM